MSLVRRLAAQVRIVAQRERELAEARALLARLTADAVTQHCERHDVSLWALAQQIGIAGQNLHQVVKRPTNSPTVVAWLLARGGNADA